jgi:hypothetical protein
MTSIKRVSYAYNSVLEDQGQDAYFLDAMVFEDGQAVVDVHQAFKTRQEFMAKALEIVPVLGNDTTDKTDAISTFV